MKNAIRFISILVVISLVGGLCACKKAQDNTSSATNTTTTTTIIDSTDGINNQENIQSQNSSGTAGVQSGNSQPSVANPNESAQPNVTICTRVAADVYIVGGTCSNATEYISVSGNNVTPTKITPVKGQNQKYFTGQVKIGAGAAIEIQAKETGKDLSSKIVRTASVNQNQNNLMTNSDYAVVFGSQSRAHYYSSILTYTKSELLDNNEKEYAKMNMQNVVSAAKSTGAEVIYLVVPSSAAVYPETVPGEYKAASGETLYKTFKNIAESTGAKVIYPLDVFQSHKNDGEGFKIYSNTDSHWTTYGAYWGVHSLMNYISAKHPSAKPRTTAEMGFYTAELYGGDMLFSFGDGKGFENYSQAAATNGATSITGINELTTLYKLKMPTDTLSKITRGKKSVYLTKDNQYAKTETNSAGTGLPSAIVVRDSFGRTAYDMVNDRFSKVRWLDEGDYTSVINEISSTKPNYVIYIVSERNLHKVMFNNKDIQLINLV